MGPTDARRRVAAVLAAALALVGSACGANDGGSAQAASRPAAVATVAPSGTTVSTTLASSNVAPSTSTTRRKAVTTTSTAAKPAGPVVDKRCPSTGHGALVDRVHQRAYLCTNGKRGAAILVTTAITMPDPGVYKVYAKDMKATSMFGGHFSTMTHFVAFTYGKRTHARIAFHSLPKLRNGSYVQNPKTVGRVSFRGQSNGCIRVLPTDAVRIWNHLAVGDTVRVLN